MDVARPTAPMDVIGQTTPIVVDASPESMATALQQLHDLNAIRNLAALYAVSRDDHDIDALMSCFAPDGTFASHGQPICGHDALRKYYLGNMRRTVFSLHTPHSHVVTFESPAKATGLMTGHAEFAHRDAYMMCAYRYNDRYVKQDGRWVFAYRDHAFMYSVPSDSMPGLAREECRVRWPDTAPRRADWAPRSV